MADPQQRQSRQAVEIDQALVEPARRGVRKVGTGIGKVASGGLIAAGGVSGLFGGLLMALTTGFFSGLGAFFLAAGLTAGLIGGLGFFAMGRADSKGDEREIERRLIKLVGAYGRVSDEAIAKRISVPVEAIRETANRLVKAGRLDVDIDPESGADIYALPQTTDINALMPAEEAAAFEGFEERLGQAPEQAPVAQRVEQVQTEPEYEER